MKCKHLKEIKKHASKREKKLLAQIDDQEERTHHFANKMSEAHNENFLLRRQIHDLKVGDQPVEEPEGTLPQALFKIRVLKAALVQERERNVSTTERRIELEQDCQRLEKRLAQEKQRREDIGERMDGSLAAQAELHREIGRLRGYVKEG